METARILWRRLDRPGHDLCTLHQQDEEWQIKGTAIWQDMTGPAQLTYTVTYDNEWQSRIAHVSGWVGDQDIDIILHHDEGAAWEYNGHMISDSEGLVDVDLGFTPATNTSSLCRLSHNTAQHDFNVLWLDDSDWQLKPLQQGYMRKAERLWKYRSPTHDFQVELTVNKNGFVTNYPGLWIEEV